jgi:hypothetical protein
MKVLISWSGERSKAIASALKNWLPHVFQKLQVFMSDHDIQAGVRWGSELDGTLETCNFGIICLTPESLESHWLTFEAGALSKSIKESRVIPYRFQLQASDVGPPLKLILSINEALDHPFLDEEKVRLAFSVWWPILGKMLDEIPLTAEREIRSDRAVLEEILEIVRQSGMRDLNNLLGQVLLLPNVRRVEVAPKMIAGEASNRLALRITVAKKLPLGQIAPDQLIPSSIFGMPTDVVEGAS